MAPCRYQRHVELKDRGDDMSWRQSADDLYNELQREKRRNEKLQSEIDGLDGHYSSELIDKDEEIAWLMNEIFDLKNKQST